MITVEKLTRGTKEELVKHFKSIQVCESPEHPSIEDQINNIYKKQPHFGAVMVLYKCDNGKNKWTSHWVYINKTHD